MKRILKFIRLRDESGAIMVIVAVAMLGLIGFTALAVDGGRIYSEKSKLQKAVDSAVLAGAQGLLTSDSSAARDIAEDMFFEKYGYDSGLIFDLTIEPGQYIKGEAKTIPISMTFAKAIGTDVAYINASAKAIVGPLTKASGIAPIVIEKDNIPDGTILNCGSTNPGDLNGNCGYLNFPDGNLRDALLNGGTYEVGQTVITDPGGSVGQVSQAIMGVDGLIALDASKSHCQSHETADNTCARVVTVVVIDDWVDIDGKKVTGSSELRVSGFAAYWIEKYEDKKLYGRFIEMIAPGTIGSGPGTGNNTLYGVKLAE
ncbi:hypothetical protein E2R56_13375 [Rhodococcus qingshengii]|nr:hypothetical protein E2R56_13375 [Rhodococcus qingshengii]